MFDKDIVIENLKHICCAIDKIIKRFAYIDSANDFLKDDTGLEKLDSICMQLIVIGEMLKKIDKMTNSKLFLNYPEINWKRVKGMRDFITHQYFDIDSETVFVVCNEHIPRLKKVI